MVALVEEPAIFKLIRNPDVSLDSVRLYLQHYPSSVKLPVYQDETVLSVAVNACFAVVSADIAEDENVQESLVNQLRVLQVVAEYCSLLEILNDGKTIFHVAVSPMEDDEDAATTVQVLVSNAIVGILLDQLKPEHYSVLFVRDLVTHQLAIHVAIHHHNEKAARKLLNVMWKECATYRDYDLLDDERRTPLLHESLYFTPTTSSKFLSLIFTLFPDAASTVDSDGMLPIVLALEHSLPARKLRLILEANPAALSVPTGDGDLPLHLAAMYYPQQHDVLDMIIQNYPLALTVTNCHGQLPLHCAMEFQNDKKGFVLSPQANLFVVQVLSNHRSCKDDVDDSELSCDQPSTSVTNSSLSSSLSTLSINDSGIHALPCRDGSMMDPSLRNSPSEGSDMKQTSALYHKDSYGELPIHIACRRLSPHSFEVLSWLLQCYPESAGETNNYGHLPMHLLAASESHDACDETVQNCFKLLWSSNPNALHTPDDEGDVPLQCLVSHQCSSPALLHCIIEKASNEEPQFRSMENRLTGDLPLHTACINGIFSADILDPLIAFDPSALQHYDNDGYLPFHSALLGQKNCTIAVLKKLLYRKEDGTRSDCPSILSTLPSTKDGTPALFIACENANHRLDDDEVFSQNETQALDIIRFIVENSPDLFATSS